MISDVKQNIFFGSIVKGFDGTYIVFKRGNKMNRAEFLNTVKSEDLHFNLLFKKPHNDIFSYGYYEEGGNYIVFQTDERACPFLTWTFKTESEALDFLLNRLRNEKIIESYIK